MSFHSNSQVFERLVSQETKNSSIRRNQAQDGTGHGVATNYTSRTTSSRRVQSSNVSSSLFNRLANTETYATASMKGKIQSPPTHERQRRIQSTKLPSDSGIWNRLAYTETFSSSQMKRMNDPLPSTPISQRTTSSSFFHRMAYSETFATASKKGLVDDSPGKSSSKKITNNEFFDRMSKADTFSSASKKATYDYGKGPSTPSRKIHTGGRTNVFDRLANTDTKALSLKKSSTWNSREERRSRSAPRISTKMPYYRKYNYEKKPVTPDSIASARSAARSQTSFKSFRSNVVDYEMSPQRTLSFNDRITRVEIKSNTKPKSVLKKPSISPPKKKPPITPTKKKPPISPVRKTFHRSSPQSLTKRTTASDRSRQNSAAERKSKQQQRMKKAPSPTHSLKTATTASSLSSFASRSIQKPKQSAPKTKPAPRPVLQFDSDDDFSFSDESKDESEENILPPPPQDVQSKDISPTGGIEINITDENTEVVENNTNEEEEEALSVDTASVDDILGDSHQDKVENMKQDLPQPKIEIVEEDILGLSQYDDEALSSNMDVHPIANDNSLENMSIDEEDAFDEEDNVSPVDEVDDVSPVDEEYGVSPDNEVDDVYPDNEEDDVSPDDEEENVTPDDEEDDVTPVDEENNVTPVDEEDNVSPDDEKDDVSPVDEEDEVLENKSIECDEAEESNVIGRKHRDGEAEESNVIVEEKEEDELDDILDEPVVNEEASAPLTNVDDDDDFSFEESISEDEENTKTPVQVEDNMDAEYDEQLPEESTRSLEESPMEDEVRQSNTLDSLDFILDAEEPEEDETEKVIIPKIKEEVHMEDDEEDFSDDSLSLFNDSSSFEDENQIIEETIIEEDEEEEEELSEQDEYEEEPEMEDEEEMEELPPLKYKLFISDKYHPEYGLEEHYPEDLYLVDSLLAFEEGAISKQELSVLVIEALFERDFEDGEHWEIDAGTARDLEDDEGGGGDLQGCAFVVKRQARLDWNDLYSVAAAKGTIIISAEKDEIKVENYSYFVAG